MLQRLIPILQVHRGELYKTVRFKPRYYVGDPVNSVRVFNLKGVDELLVVDIDATQTGNINFDLVKRLGSQSFMPLSYGGGISRLDQVDHLFDLGIDKVLVGSSAVTQPALLELIARKYGSQALIVSIDVKKAIYGHSYYSYYAGGKIKFKSQHPLSFAQQAVKNGAGEIILQDITRDGTKIGLNHEMISYFSKNLTVPLIAAGGANSWDDMRKAIDLSGASAAASGSQFTFYGKYNAVLQNYPTQI